MLRSLRNAFITGIVVILPLGVTIIVIRFLLDKIGTPASKYFFWFLEPELKSMPIAQVGLEFISVLVRAAAHHLTRLRFAHLYRPYPT